MTMFNMVQEFHKLYEINAPETACELNYFRQKLRFALIEEEYKEYQEAAASGNLQDIAKELADLVYVVLGTAIEHGLIRFDEIFAEVHKSNLTKLGIDGKPVRNEVGKVIKGPHYVEANLDELI